MTTRRDFIKSMTAAATMAGVAGAPNFSFGQTTSGKTFIKVFMRGGADGMHLFPPYKDNAYHEYRPNIAIKAPDDQNKDSAINMGHELRGMNPNFELLMNIWDKGNMMLAPATSFKEANRSHFDCQRWIGTGVKNNLIDGYLNRYMQSVDGTSDPLRAIVAGKTGISTELRGKIPVPAVNEGSRYTLSNSDLQCEGCADNQLTEYMREISSHNVDVTGAELAVRENQIILLDSIAKVREAGINYKPANGLVYNEQTGIGRGLKLCAQLLKAGVPLEVAAIDWNIGWDTHSNQIAKSNKPITDANKGYNASIAKGASDFYTFWQDMGLEAMKDIVVLVCTEFGRTKKENGNFGTDHGRGGAWFAFGGPAQPVVANDITTIDDSAFKENWLPPVTDYRNIVGEIMIRHMGMSEQLISTIFPNHQFTDYELFKSPSV